MKSHLCLVILATLVFSSGAHAQDESADAIRDMENSPLVEVSIPADITQDYQTRREDHGWMFGINYETYKPTGFVSVLDNVATYENMFGSTPIELVEAEVSYKMNFAAGALTAGVGFGGGQVTGYGSDSQDHKIELTKTFLSASYILDTLFPEPYVAPYVKGQMYRFGLKETNATASFSADSQIGTAYTLGVLLQLDALDHDGSRESVRSWGLQNTFIDVYLTKYMDTSGADDPKTANNFDYGAGLRLEF